MSFPHRTAFYDKKRDKILYPDNSGGGCEYGDVYSILGKGHPQKHDYKVDHLVALTSTGLEDSEGNEIFEGHILELWETNYVMEWNGYGSFEAKTMDLNCCLDESKIKGHALTDPELIPDSFDTEEYFDL